MAILRYVWNGRISGIIGAIIISAKSFYMKIKDKMTTIIVKNNINKTGKKTQIHSGIIYRYPGNITLGNNVIIARNVTLISETTDGKLLIDDNVIITFDTRIDFSGGIKIGRNSLISKNTIIETHSHGLNPHSKPNFQELEIGENVWIGMNSLILSGVQKIGSNSIIAAGSVVTKEVPENCIVGGVPAKILKQKPTIEFI